MPIWSAILEARLQDIDQQPTEYQACRHNIGSREAFAASILYSKCFHLSWISQQPKCGVQSLVTLAKNNSKHKKQQPHKSKQNKQKQTRASEQANKQMFWAGAQVNFRFDDPFLPFVLREARAVHAAHAVHAVHALVVSGVLSGTVAGVLFQHMFVLGRQHVKQTHRFWCTPDTSQR